MYPHNTEMDLSIAYALYFAARGHGSCQESPGSEDGSYATTARVLLSGLGADELFGGYVRHATAFSRNGYSGLVEELKLDMSRLGKRNLGRDDRVMAHWEREVRFPYLDEALAKWAIESPVWDKCDFENQGHDEGVEPGKRVLRLLAEGLGMGVVAREKKRAVSDILKRPLPRESFSISSLQHRLTALYRFNLGPGRPRWRVAKSREQHSLIEPGDKCLNASTTTGRDDSTDTSEPLFRRRPRWKPMCVCESEPLVGFVGCAVTGNKAMTS